MELVGYDDKNLLFLGPSWDLDTGDGGRSLYHHVYLMCGHYGISLVGKTTFEEFRGSYKMAKYTSVWLILSSLKQLKQAGVYQFPSPGQSVEEQQKQHCHLSGTPQEDFFLELETMWWLLVKLKSQGFHPHLGKNALQWAAKPVFSHLDAGEGAGSFLIPPPFSPLT